MSTETEREPKVFAIPRGARVTTVTLYAYSADDFNEICDRERDCPGFEITRPVRPSDRRADGARGIVVARFDRSKGQRLREVDGKRAATRPGARMEGEGRWR